MEAALNRTSSGETDQPFQVPEGTLSRIARGLNILESHPLSAISSLDALDPYLAPPEGASGRASSAAHPPAISPRASRALFQANAAPMSPEPEEPRLLAAHSTAAVDVACGGSGHLFGIQEDVSEGRAPDPASESLAELPLAAELGRRMSRDVETQTPEPGSVSPEERSPGGEPPAAAPPPPPFPRQSAPRLASPQDPSPRPPETATVDCGLEADFDADAIAEAVLLADAAVNGNRHVCTAPDPAAAAAAYDDSFDFGDDGGVGPESGAAAGGLRGRSGRLSVDGTFRRKPRPIPGLAAAAFGGGRGSAETRFFGSPGRQAGFNPRLHTTAGRPLSNPAPGGNRRPAGLGMQKNAAKGRPLLGKENGPEVGARKKRGSLDDAWVAADVGLAREKRSSLPHAHGTPLLFPPLHFFLQDDRRRLARKMARNGLEIFSCTND